ncbi:tRNA pseudouridine32 synthase / 23S rRNA pseudouridine746 synthase [Colwellia chukchiensis]|uniref:tRNA pseudouridine32 synthase / 23S rRNA pseudouridine746 synthase n=1 Tax=Colwellia chukchiensis TaxID=641665 RepID=A0A1H7HTH6_9GAMM|nr:TIGR01621 family pseudouridine synthase [Colwellia chukchiensis]SEK52852.1 tRNA pseudouridine32 synthase / 23S rRNA pseudouridine746 synthase [Colwellia chukchiensis]
MSANLTVIADQDDFIVIDKPQDVSFHDEEKVGSGLFSQLKQQLRAQAGLNELYPVHRLDKMTSGLIIMAKNQATARAFQQLFAQHQVEKYYLAIADGKPKKKQGLIKGDMVKSRRGMWKLLRSTDNPAISQFFSFSIAPKRRLYLLKPHSGKSHQIRVALNSIGVPILGDPLYSDKHTCSDRGYLHAFALAFTLHNKRYQYCLPPTEGASFNSPAALALITQLSPPWQQPWPAL